MSSPTTKLFRTGFPSHEIRHSKLWNAIFDDYEWLNDMANEGHHCMLLGSDLNHIYHHNVEDVLQKSSEMNFVLVCGKHWIPNEDRTSKFLKCLKKTISPIEKPLPNEVTIAYRDDYTIRLSIRALWNEYKTKLMFDEPQNLFSLSCDQLHSAYVYWKYDDMILHDLHPEKIVGIGRNASTSWTTYYVSNVCGITIEKPVQAPADDPHLKDFPWQIVICKPRGAFGVVKNYKNENELEIMMSQPCIGWKYDEELSQHNEGLWD